MLNNIIVKVQKTISSEAQQAVVINKLNANLKGMSFGQLKLIALMPVSEIVAQYAK